MKYTGINEVKLFSITKIFDDEDLCDKIKQIFFLVVVPRCEDIKYKRPLGTNIGYIHLKSFDIFLCMGKKIDFSTDIMKILLRKKNIRVNNNVNIFLVCMHHLKKKKE